MSQNLKIGSRTSQLAMIQSEHVKELLMQKNPGLQLEIVPISTKGDKILDVALSKIGDKGLFTSELENSMINKEIDFAVHSLKDVPTNFSSELTLGAITERHNPKDCLILHEKHKGKTLETLEKDSVIGTSSLRRVAQLQKNFAHLKFEDVRGNLNTRLSKLDNSGKYDGLILAVSGVERLNFGSRIDSIIDQSICMYAVGQGALAIQCRQNDSNLIKLLETINHKETEITTLAERSFLRTLEGGCSVPIGVNSELKNENNEMFLTLRGIVLNIDGSKSTQNEITEKLNSNELENHANIIGQKLGNMLKESGAQEILNELNL